MSDTLTDPPLLHIYAQKAPHDRADIIGNRAGLERLRDALTAALESWTAVTVDGMFTADGEEFDVVVWHERRPWQDAAWQERMRLPYTGEGFRRSPAPEK